MKKLLTCILFCTSLFAFFSCAKKEQKTTLNFLETMTAPDRTATIKQIIADFEQQHPDITINLISPPYDQAQNRASLMLTNEDPLDIIEVRDYDVRQYVNNGKLTNLEDMIAKWDEGKDLLPITMACARTTDNTAYILPQFLYVKALFIRTDILAANGITEADYPKTNEELYALCRKITDPAKNQFGFDFRGKANEFKISDLLILADVDNIDPNNVYKTLDGKFSFAEPSALSALEDYIAMFKSSVPSDGINWAFNEQVNSFVSGITPFLIQDPDTVGLLDTQLGRDKYTVIPLTVGKSGKAPIDYGYASLSIPSYSKNKELAWEFISYMSSAKVNAELCKKYGPLPTHISTFKDDPYFSTGVYKAWDTQFSSPDKYLLVKFPLDDEKWPGWPQAHEQYMQSALLGNISAEDLIQKSTDYWK